MFNSLVLLLAMHCGPLNLEQQDRGDKQYAGVKITRNYSIFWKLGVAWGIWSMVRSLIQR